MLPNPTKRAFIWGPRRSGSNLLQTIVSMHGFSAPHAEHLYAAFVPMLDGYGDLNEDENWAQLIADICCYTNNAPVPFMSRKVLTQEVLPCAPRTLEALQDWLYRLHMQETGAHSWLNKSNNLLIFADNMQAAYGTNARYIQLYRDPRDCMLSFFKAPVGPKHPWVIGKDWLSEMQQMEAWNQQHPDQCVWVRYERLLNDPQAQLDEICAVLEVEADYTSLQNFHKSDRAQKASASGKLWENLKQPLLTQNSRKWMRNATPEDIQIIESAIGHNTMQRLGYEPYCRDELRFSAEQISAFEDEDGRRKQKAMKLNHLDPSLRQGQFAVLEKIAKRRDGDAAKPKDMTDLGRV